MGTLVNIEAALIGRTNSLVLSPELTIAWPNVKFEPPADGDSYLNVDHLPNTTERIFLNGADPHRHLGIWKISVLIREGGGATDGSAILDSIRDHFPADLRLYEGGLIVRVTKTPDAIPAFRDETRWRVPVDIPYESFTL